MKKILFVISIFIFFSCSDILDEKVVTHGDGTIEKVVKYRNHSTKKIIYYPSGKLQSEGFLIDNKYNGSVKLYDENGNIIEDANYVRGIKNGRVISYFSSGKIDWIANEKNGKYEGQCLFFYENGNVKSSFYFSKNLRTGTSYDFYENDSAKIHFKYKHYILSFEEKEHSMWVSTIEYDKSGKIINEDARVNILREKDTVQLGDTLNLVLEVSKPKHNMSRAHVGGLDEFFELQDSSSVYQVEGKEHQVKLQVEAKKLGLNILRGYMEDYDIDSLGADGFYRTTGSIGNYFEYEYYVLPK